MFCSVLPCAPLLVISVPCEHRSRFAQKARIEFSEMCPGSAVLKNDVHNAQTFVSSTADIFQNRFWVSTNAIHLSWCCTDASSHEGTSANSHLEAYTYAFKPNPVAMPIMEATMMADKQHSLVRNAIQLVDNSPPCACPDMVQGM